jgi:predicted DNA-binding transcriptional regulator AlpA
VEKKTLAVIGYASIAKKMGTSVEHVRNLRGKDPDFPKPVTAPEFRSPGFDEAEIDAYMKARAERPRNSTGRPPRQGAARRKLPIEVNRKIEALVREAGTLAEFTRLLEVSDMTLRNRFAGTTTWREGELAAIAARLGISEEELTAPPESA